MRELWPSFVESSGKRSPVTTAPQLTFAGDSDVASGVDHCGLDEPGDSEADQDVEHIAPDRVRNGHVAVAWK